MICSYFKKTGIQLPEGHKIEAECKICPLREPSGDCIRDICHDLGELYGEMIEKRTSAIWDKFNKKEIK